MFIQQYVLENNSEVIVTLGVKKSGVLVFREQQFLYEKSLAAPCGHTLRGGSLPRAFAAIVEPETTSMLGCKVNDEISDFDHGLRGVKICPMGAHVSLVVTRCE